MLAGTDTTEPADISFRADLSKIDWMEGFDENKRLLVKLLDKMGFTITTLKLTIKRP